MKTHFRTLFIIILALFFSQDYSYAAEVRTHDLNQSTGTVSVIYADAQCPAYLTETWNINIGESKLIKFNCSVDLGGDDNLFIYDVDDNGNDILLAGPYPSIKDITTKTANGKAKIVFTTQDYPGGDGTYRGFTINFSPDESYTIANDVHITGNTLIEGNIGIGVAKPLENLHINGYIRGPLKIRTNDKYINLTPGTGSCSFSTNSNSFAFNKPINLTTGEISCIGRGNLSLKTNGTSRITALYSNGNVGIGTTTPSEKLTVDGNISVGIEKTDVTGYGNKILFRGVDSPDDEMSIARYNTDPNKSELRVTIADDQSGEDKFVIGNVYWEAPSQWRSFLSVVNNGRVGINTSNPQYTLDVKGTIRAAEIKVESVDNFADFVFEKNYKLPDLKEVHQFILKNGHLSGIPSAADVKENGMSLVDMQIKLLQKIEELTLYIIKQEEKIKELENKLQ